MDIHSQLIELRIVQVVVRFLLAILDDPKQEWNNPKYFKKRARSEAQWESAADAFNEQYQGRQVQSETGELRQVPALTGRVCHRLYQDSLRQARNKNHRQPQPQPQQTAEAMQQPALVSPGPFASRGNAAAASFVSPSPGPNHHFTNQRGSTTTGLNYSTPGTTNQWGSATTTSLPESMAGYSPHYCSLRALELQHEMIETAKRDLLSAQKDANADVLTAQKEANAEVRAAQERANAEVRAAQERANAAARAAQERANAEVRAGREKSNAEMRSNHDKTHDSIMALVNRQLAKVDGYIQTLPEDAFETASVPQARVLFPGNGKVEEPQPEAPFYFGRDKKIKEELNIPLRYLLVKMPGVDEPVLYEFINVRGDGRCFWHCVYASGILSYDERGNGNPAPVPVEEIRRSLRQFIENNPYGRRALEAYCKYIEGGEDDQFEATLEESLDILHPKYDHITAPSTTSSLIAMFSYISRHPTYVLMDGPGGFAVLHLAEKVNEFVEAGQRDGLAFPANDHAWNNENSLVVFHHDANDPTNPHAPDRNHFGLLRPVPPEERARILATEPVYCGGGSWLNI